ncbi:DUF7373 family lipoprotein [Nocardia aurantiaca]|uniref:Uncharacterized protein n=1 Tax=Nocardia aurantiaca TaxID=2675850 RepID=A0A6I3KSQ7_9NOCA|nr:hypothetical protein [Nocardia aurantiaca]MTE11580.1 hypothetical protein [Nocardia aurantiaca]
MLDMRHGFGRLRSARIGVRAAAAAALAISLLATAGCGSESSATEDQTADLSKLDTGSFPTRPQNPTAADPAKQARILEGLRLGNVLPLASEIDPTLSRRSSGTNVFTGPNSFGDLIRIDHFADDTKGFIAGFATSARTSEDTYVGYTLTNAVMIFESEAAASSAAPALAHSGFWLADNSTTVDSVQSSQHPAAQIIWAPTEQRLASWYPTGRFVVFTMIDQVENLMVNKAFDIASDPAPTALADKAIDITTDRLKHFHPTALDQLAKLPLDPDGLLRLTLPRPAGDQTGDGFTGTLDQHGALHTVGDPARFRALFEKTGVDFFSYGAGILVRTKDAASAQTFLDTAFASRFQHRIEPPAGLSTAHCVKYHGPDEHAAPFSCYVAYGRYVATMVSQQQQDVYQRISAQYAILANNK